MLSAFEPSDPPSDEAPEHVELSARELELGVEGMLDHAAGRDKALEINQRDRRVVSSVGHWVTTTSTAPAAGIGRSAMC